MLYFEKSQPTPECLAIEKQKTNGDYKCGGVLSRLKEDFKNKCYICEKLEPSSINVEHFIPHKGNLDLKFSWKNLFWSCSHCNNTKLANFDNILDCTNVTDRVEDRLKYSLKPFPREKIVIEALDDKEPTHMTKALVEKVFNGETKLKTIESANIREEILKEILEFQTYLFEYFDSTYDEEDKKFILRKIKSHLNQSSNFTSFKRWIIRENKELFNEFGKYC